MFDCKRHEIAARYVGEGGGGPNPAYPLSSTWYPTCRAMSADKYINKEIHKKVNNERSHAERTK